MPVAAQFLELVEFYVLGRSAPPEGREARGRPARAGVAAVTRALTLPAYHVVDAHELIARMQPGPRRRRRDRAHRHRPRGHRGRRPRGVGRPVPAAARRRAVHRERVEDQGVEEVLFAAGSSYVQLLGALGPDTPVGRFLATRGPGLHHVAYRVDDIEAALARLRADGARLIDEAPRPGSAAR